MAAIKHFAAPAGMTTPPPSFAAGRRPYRASPGFDENGALPDDFRAQFGFVVQNINRVLHEAGASFRGLVKVNVLLTRFLRQP
jgi:2-iminobutanoate/2-iminopropanoate deaminase